MTALFLAYAAAAYWLFWHAIDRRNGETPALIVGRAALYLVAGPVLWLGAWGGAAVALSAYEWEYWRAK
jgi:hypothetical protein